MTNEQIKKIALANGFVLKASFDGKEYADLHPYVYGFARALLAAAPTPPAQGNAGYRLTYKDGSTISIDREPNSHELRECMIEPITVATPPAPEVEPVAYMRNVTEGWGTEFNTIDEWSDGKAGGTPLYTHPANDGLRKAAEELVRDFDLSCRDSACYGSVTRVENLRAELNKDKSC